MSVTSKAGRADPELPARGGRIVFATQVIDPEHPFLGAAVAKIRALAERVDEIVVLAGSAEECALPDNCRVRLFDAGSRAGRGSLFAAALARELRPRPLAVVAHLVPLYAILAAPLAQPLRIPVLLWFTQWKATRRLVLAERVSTAVLSVDRRSFPLASGKVVPIGHGVDTEWFACVEREAGPRLRAVALGRTSPSKELETIVRAATLAGVDLELRGPSSNATERAERARLEALGVLIEPPLPYLEIPSLLSRKDVLVNNTREGALDKVVYEAAATCMPVLASSSGFDDILPAGLRFAAGDPEGLASRFRELADADRGGVGRELRARVVERHSAGHWADEVLAVARR